MDGPPKQMDELEAPVPNSPLTDAFIKPGIPALVLAPMEGVADAPMRAFLSQQGGFTFCVSEFVRISQTVPGPRTFRERIPELLNDCRTPAGLPVQIQLLGGDPERLAQAAVVAVRAGARAVDLNFGCPAKTVNQHDGGATLLRFPNRIRELVSAVRRAVPTHLPVSAKLRLGWDNVMAIHANAECAAEGGAAWITIHARTKEQGYRPPAYWEPIAAVRAGLGIPVVANGEIWTVEDLRRCRGETGCEHFMLGRGALANPALARAAALELGVASRVDPESRLELPADWLPLVRGFVELSLAAGRTPAGTAARVKQWLSMVNHNSRLPWIDAIRRQQSLTEMLNQLTERAGPSYGGEGPAGKRVA
jgi:tRNA-dihydrouridine synthase C